MSKQCRKVKHRTITAAIIALKKVKNAQLNAYQCEECGYFHLGRSNEWHKVQARLDQLFAKIKDREVRA